MDPLGHAVDRRPHYDGIVVDKKYEGDNHEGPGRSSPYGLSRLAPETSLVDVAREISEADTLIAQSTSSKLKLIAAQIRQLQAQAKEIVDDASRDLALHRATCSFSRRIGKTYHLYEKVNGDLMWSMLAPDEWDAPYTSRGSYRLDPDQSWTPAEEVREDEDPLGTDAVIQKLLPSGS